MASADPRLKHLRIKAGVVKRLAKEKQMYSKEVSDYKEKIEKMKADGKDSYDIKKTEELLHESESMVPDTTRRLKAAHDELKILLENATDLQAAEEYIAAQNALEKVGTVEI